MITKEVMATLECNICLQAFKHHELQNPRFCCSVRMCQSCFKLTLVSALRTLNCQSQSQSQSHNLYNSDAFQINNDGMAWMSNGNLHRDDDLPALIKYYESGQKKSEYWYLNGNAHRDGDLP